MASPLLEHYVGLLVKEEMSHQAAVVISSLEDLKAKYEDKMTYLFVFERPTSISLSNVVIKKEYRNQGIGTQFMRDLTAYADSVHKTIVLSPTNEFGSSLARLKAFYKSFGFVENKGRNRNFEISDSMYRIPA